MMVFLSKNNITIIIAFGVEFECCDGDDLGYLLEELVEEYCVDAGGDADVDDHHSLHCY